MATAHTIAALKAELAVAQRRGDFSAVETAMKKIELTVIECAERRRTQSGTHTAPTWDRDDNRQ